MDKTPVMVIQVNEQDLVVVSQAGDFLQVHKPAGAIRPGQTLLIHVPSDLPLPSPVASAPSPHQPLLTALSQKIHKLLPTASMATLSRLSWHSRLSQLPRHSRHLAAAALFFLVLTLSLTVPNQFSTQPAIASVIVDMGAKFELLTDEQGCVVGTKADTSEGDTLLKKVAVQGLPVDEALIAIANEAMSTGFITADTLEQAKVELQPPAAPTQFSSPLSADTLQKHLHRQAKQKKTNTDNPENIQDRKDLNETNRSSAIAAPREPSTTTEDHNGMTKEFTKNKQIPQPEKKYKQAPLKAPQYKQHKQAPTENPLQSEAINNQTFAKKTIMPTDKKRGHPSKKAQNPNKEKQEKSNQQSK
ncbi:anti-sigma-I factor RsgI family protein [Heliophilum fasciatum]|uniref:Anti-sigma factor RsgI-like middle domain-containing protein n=1 Tax=Heliophilum fasciatum TaxID=35700 RepID=A0A4R2S0R4_9FIRM|nr:hypothetical protein [Heliophilum fasciatum]MCW2276608.1 hypothetical protein [Heliophilum fasciatum]TCP69009.1 hypothetical protein EDD73_101177 [Heliophilum fasciatum]